MESSSRRAQDPHLPSAIDVALPHWITAGGRRLPEASCSARNWQASSERRYVSTDLVLVIPGAVIEPRTETKDLDRCHHCRDGYLGPIGPAPKNSTSSCR